jgi:uncharacterized surface protein with fasciclin (FAS1) repeats
MPHRRLFVVLCFVFLAAISPVLAQDPTPASPLPTIRDFAISLTQINPPLFTRLNAGIQLASQVDPTVDTLLDDPNAHVTLFAPTDAGFQSFIDQIGQERFEEIGYTDPEGITNALKYHIVQGVYSLADLELLVDENAGLAVLPTVQGQYIDVTRAEDGTLLIDGVALDTSVPEFVLENGVIHTLSLLLQPELRTITEIMTEEGSGESTDFTPLLGAAPPRSELASAFSDPNQQLTVFAPNVEANEALGSEALTEQLTNPELMERIIGYHTVLGVVHSGDLRGAVAFEESFVGLTVTLNTWISLPLTVTATGSDLMVNDIEIVRTDIDAVNGVIHVVNRVLIPPA